jgi:hypothetical protein
VSMFIRSDCHSGRTARQLTPLSGLAGNPTLTETPVGSQALRVRPTMKAGGQNHAECSRDRRIGGGENTTVTSSCSARRFGCVPSVASAFTDCRLRWRGNDRPCVSGGLFMHLCFDFCRLFCVAASESSTARRSPRIRSASARAILAAPSSRSGVERSTSAAASSRSASSSASYSASLSRAVRATC